MFFILRINFALLWKMFLSKFANKFNFHAGTDFSSFNIFHIFFGFMIWVIQYWKYLGNLFFNWVTLYSIFRFQLYESQVEINRTCEGWENITFLVEKTKYRIE